MVIGSVVYKNMKKVYSRGFTLVEVLVVIGIIALLTTVVYASLSRATAKSRDGERIALVSNVQLALSYYYSHFNAYPQTLGAMGEDYLKNVPDLDCASFLLPGEEDKLCYVPLTKTGSTYSKCQGTDTCTYYHLGVRLELPNPQLDQDKDFDSLPDGFAGEDESGSQVFDITP